MRSVVKIGIYHYIAEVVHEKTISRMIDEWNIEYETIIAILVNHFESLGIYELSPIYHEAIVLNSIMHQLQYSPDITSRLEKMRATQEEEAHLRRRKTGSN